MGLNHILTPMLCRSRRIWVLHVISGSCALLVGIALGLSGREWARSARRKPAEATLAATEEVAQGQFLSVVAVMAATFFLMLIIATSIPAILVDPCQQ